MKTAILPTSSFVQIETRRLQNPEVVWTSSDAELGGFDPAEVFCCPQNEGSDGVFSKDTRVEHADRYGGIGTGLNGGSGRCSIGAIGLQTKGVGVTPLVARSEDNIHHSGVVHLMEACCEAVYGQAYSYFLPFGATPVLAIVLTGEQYFYESRFDPRAMRQRALIFRPFVARPAHFLRNLNFPEGIVAAGSVAPGMSRDTFRTTEAMKCFARNLQQALDPTPSWKDERAILDCGLRELARRFAWQAAAAFAKRMPHGSLSCSNVALSGAYLDYGLTQHVAAYRRQAWPNWLDPWSEHIALAQTLVSIRQQLDRYLAGVRDMKIVGANELAAIFRTQYQKRETLEMAKMGGLTEDMAVLCPENLLNSWCIAMKAIWRAGADEPYLTQYEGLMESGGPTPSPRAQGRFDLSEVLAISGRAINAEQMDRDLAEVLSDVSLRKAYVASAIEVRKWLRAWAGDRDGRTDAYIALQAARKNESLDFLRREYNGSHRALSEIEGSSDAARAAAIHIGSMLKRARWVLADLEPGTEGETGVAQIDNIPMRLLDSRKPLA